MQAVQAAINAKLPGRFNFITDRNEDLTTFVVTSTVDRLPPQHYLYFKESDRLAGLPTTYPNLREVLNSFLRIDFKKLAIASGDALAKAGVDWP